MNTISMPATPTQVGQRVRTCGYGGEVRMSMDWGTVVRFNRSGFPVIAVDYTPSYGERVVTDRFGAFRVVDEDGYWVTEEREVVR